MPGKRVLYIMVYRANRPTNPEPPYYAYAAHHWVRRDGTPSQPMNPRTVAFELTSAQITQLARAVNRAVRAGRGQLRLINTAGYFGWTWYREED